MKIRITYKDLLLQVAFFCLVVSQSTALVSTVLQNVFEYGGIICLIILLVRNTSIKRCFIEKKWYSLIVFWGLTIGLLVQNMSSAVKINALIPPIIFVMVFTRSEGIVADLKTLRHISYSIIYALIVAFFLAVIYQQPLFEANGMGGLFYIGFNGGILYKNYYSSTVLVALAGLYLYLKYEKKKKNVDFFVCGVLLLMIFMASSKGTGLILCSFCGVEWLGYFIYNIKKSQRLSLINIFIAVGFGAFLILFESIALKNQNYLYRMNGLFNYLAKYGNDLFYIVFGNGELAYAPGKSYVNNIIAAIGWDGSLELSWLGILIKNGLIGIITYLIVFIFLIKKAINEKQKNSKIIMIATIVSLIISSLVETYIQNIHVIFGIYMFIVAFNCHYFLGEKQKIIGDDK